MNEDENGISEEDVTNILAQSYPEVEEIYTEETINKVFRAIKRGADISDEQIEDIINEMQNEGILFRERG